MGSGDSIRPMYSTMQEFPLTLAAIMRHGCGIHGARTVTTALGDGEYRQISYREVGEQAAQLANALRRIGVSGDQRVATFMWNNAEHLAAYLAVPTICNDLMPYLEKNNDHHIASLRRVSCGGSEVQV
jgi:acyl-CoA synthetase (AMP-forming)/AMP-acid ligase II